MALLAATQMTWPDVICFVAGIVGLCFIAYLIGRD